MRNRHQPALLRRRDLRLHTLLLASVLVLIAGVPAAWSQTPAPSVGPVPEDTDEDPTRPVFFSLRPEFYNIGNDIDRQQLILRYDARVWRSLRIPGGAPGGILRVEAPIVDMKAGSAHGAGLGDVYGQFLLLPRVTRRFALAVGSGFIAPTATHELTGNDKWIVAPLAVPLWRMPHGLFAVKVQNMTSVAGDSDRPDVNFLLITPILIRTVGRFWILADTETKTLWTDDGRTGVKSGFQIGRRVGNAIGIWIKPEVWWGPNRDGEWNLKFGFVWYERRR